MIKYSRDILIDRVEVGIMFSSKVEVTSRYTSFGDNSISDYVTSFLFLFNKPKCQTWR